MDTFHIALITATLLCSLVAGFLFAFAVVAMPGLGTLDDRGFVHSFQVIDRVIQRNQPLFLLVWAGSVVVLVASAFLGLGRLAGAERALLLAATVLYLVGVQLPTAMINVPLNNLLQAVDIESADSGMLAEARQTFEVRWNRWNLFRTVAATATALLLILLILRL